MLGCNKDLKNGISSHLKSGLGAVAWMASGKAKSCLRQQHDEILLAKSEEMAEQFAQIAFQEFQCFQAREIQPQHLATAFISACLTFFCFHLKAIFLGRKFT